MFNFKLTLCQFTLILTFWHKSLNNVIRQVFVFFLSDDDIFVLLQPDRDSVHGYVYIPVYTLQNLTLVWMFGLRKPEGSLQSYQQNKS